MNPYFVWKGIDSRHMRLWVAQYPALTRGAERVNQVTIPGRSGVLTLLEGAAVYDPIQLVIRVQAPARSNFDVLSDWLSGSGELILGLQSDRLYTGRIINEVAFNKVSNDIKEASVSFLCDPFKQQYPKEAAIELTSAGTIYNPGNVDALPIIKVSGSGDVALTVNSSTITLTGMTAAIVLNSSARIATNNAGTANRLSKTSGDFPVFVPGNNTISWTGTVTKLTINPEWRWR